MIYINSKVRVRITGKNIDRFINRLIRNNFTIYNLTRINRKSIIVLIPYIELDKLYEIKTIYEIDVVDYKGGKKVNKIFKENKYIIISIIIGFIILRILTSLIFNIEIVHNNKELRNIVENELSKNGIKKYSFKKNYNELNKIKDTILTKYKDNIEWIEIEEKGTKYIVRLEERINKNIIDDNKMQDIVASRDALLLNVEADKGEVIRNKNDYVHKGDVVISHNITLNGEVKRSVKAIGKIYGEVWYNVSIEYPYHYKIEKITDENKKVLAFYFFNKKIELFNFKKYKTKKITINKQLTNNVFPIKLVLENQTKTNIIEENNTKGEAIKKAELKAKEEIEKDLNEKEYIIDIKKLKVSENNSKIKVDFFVSVYKDITEVLEIVE